MTETPTPAIAFRISRADGDVLAERDPNLPFYPASTVKLAVLAAVGRGLESGALQLDQPVRSTDRFPSLVAGAPDFRILPGDEDPGMPPPGTPMPLAEVAERMIVVSSNEATNLLYDVVGFPAVNQVLADAGAVNSGVHRKFSDLAASRAGLPGNVITARDLGKLMEAVVGGRLADHHWTAWMCDMLSRQELGVIGTRVPTGTRWGSKSGWVDGIQHDVAFIGEPGPTTLVIAVCTRGFDEPQGEQCIAALTDLALAKAQRRDDASNAASS
ncbi:serine hydrolase [Nakamurella aerolata]|uniref:Serine hydrolase n=1 Tax=Nakamurella aerolata TaxID=1656892 RepID=A0A849A621_9ACTN|nr:serine hydrolase [Nakamurella aerolata]NNG36009.1 serine hydrolase [Nakamurella aerolata]